MLEDHPTILDVDKVKCGPFYDQLTIRNTETGKVEMIGAMELLPIIAEIDDLPLVIKSMDRAKQYLFTMLMELNGGVVPFGVSCLIRDTPIGIRCQMANQLPSSTRVPCPGTLDAVDINCTFNNAEFLVTCITDLVDITTNLKSMNRILKGGNHGGEERDQG